MDLPGQITLEADPNKPLLDEALARVEEELTAQALSPQDKLMALANTAGNFAEAIDQIDLNRIGNLVCDDYDQDNKDRKEWVDTAQEALDAATQERKTGRKMFPWPNSSNVNYPILANAMLQFNARAYPAVVKGDEAVLCKVIGRDNGRPSQLGQALQAFMSSPSPQALQMVGQVDPQLAQMLANTPPKKLQELPPPPPSVMWDIPPGGKTKRAQRVSEYMNTTIFYRMEDWESDTDSLLMQLPVVGCVARKVFYCAPEGRQKSVMVSMLRIVVPDGARSFDTSPRITEEIPDVFPETIAEDIRLGHYLDVDLYTKLVDGAEERTDDDKPRLLLEQHRLIDLDEDGCPEPYIVTVDYETRQVLRIEANFSPEDVQLSPDGQRVARIKKGKFFIKYSFFPHPKGKFYDIGLGHLLKQMGDVIDTAINQLMDAGSAQTAGGGFIASGVRLQSRGQGSVVRFAPGEYKTVDVSGDVLRNAIVERTLPQVSPVTFQILDLILGAAKDISGIKDVMTGEASNTGQVGTTLALIEQGLQVFNAIYKRVFRALKEEFQLLFDNIGKYGGETAAKDYMNTLDDPEADFAKDFGTTDLDIRPVSDPASVTRMQKLARAQFLLGITPQVAQTGGNVQEIMRRVLEAVDAEDVDKIYPPMSPEQQEEMQREQQMRLMAFEAEMRGKDSKAAKDLASARKDVADAAQTQFETERDALKLGAEMGAAAA